MTDDQPGEIIASLPHGAVSSFRFFISECLSEYCPHYALQKPMAPHKTHDHFPSPSNQILKAPPIIGHLKAYSF